MKKTLLLLFGLFFIVLRASAVGGALTESFYEQITLPFAPTDDVDMSSSTLVPTMYLPSTNNSYPSKGYKVTLPKSGKISLSASSNEIATNQFAFLVSTSYDASSSSQKYVGVGNGTTATLTPGTYYIILFTDNKYGKFKLNITFAALPNITSISPANGSVAGGTSVVITGTNFTGATAVKFGTTAATYTVDSDTQITATAPAGTGTVDVKVTTAGGTSATSSADQFTYVTPPTATTNAATSISSTGATLNGSINANNTSTTVTFEYGLDSSYGTTVTAIESPVTGSSATQVSKAISGLSANTTYHYRVIGMNSGGTANGSDQSFTTPKQSQTITFNALAVKTYGDADFSPVATASSGLTVSCTSSDSNVATIVGGMIHIVGTGTCTIYADQSGNNVYLSAAQASQTLTVTKAELTVTADNQTKVYGSANPTLTFKYRGWVNGEETIDTPPTISTTVDKISGANIYVDAITLSGGIDNSYTFKLIDGDFEVTKAELMVAADNQTKEYGSVNPTLTFKYSGWVNGDNEAVLDIKPTASTSVNKVTSVGIYKISVAGGIDNNYAFSYVPANLEVTKVTLIVTADNKTKAYGDANPELTFQYSGWVNGDNETVLDTKPTASTTVNETTGIGTYKILVSVGIDNNYDFLCYPGRFDVTGPKIAGDIDGNGKINGSEIAGDTNGDGKIAAPEIDGDKDGNGSISDSEVAGDTNGDGKITTPEIAGDIDGNGKINGSEIAGDINGDGKITAPEIAGDADGNGKIDETEIAGDINGDRNITLPEFIGDVNGNGKIDGSEVAGDANGNGKLDGNESIPTGINTTDRMSTLIAYSIGNTEIRLKGQVSEAAIATLYDIQGKVVVIKQLEAGDMNVIPTPYIKTGVYLLWVKDQTRIQTLKVPVKEK
jgi:hypothetical protein